MRFLFIFFMIGFFAMPAAAQNLHDFTLTKIDGTEMPMADYAGKVVLLVNTASECGFTGQYKGLQALWQQYQGRDFVVVGVPSDNFGGQELDSNAEVKDFCEINYGVNFPLAGISNVTGKDAIPLYQWANAQAGFLNSPKWNFHKYLFDRAGNYVGAFASTTDPLDKKIIDKIDSLLSE